MSVYQLGGNGKEVTVLSQQTTCLLYNGQNLYNDLGSFSHKGKREKERDCYLILGDPSVF